MRRRPINQLTGALPAAVIISVERRRRWTAQQKQAMAEKAELPGSSISSIAGKNLRT
jgi:transposase-like protein